MADVQPTPRFRPLDRSTRSTASLDEPLPPDHPARAVGDFVQHLDLSPRAARVQAVQGHAGAPAWRHDVLFALWLFATSDGSASAHELAERCQRDLPYQWLGGGAAIHYHTLSDFYSDHAELLHTLFWNRGLRSRGQPVARVRSGERMVPRQESSARAATVRKRQNAP